MTSRAFAAGLMVLLAISLSGCFANAVVDEFSTEITVPNPGTSAAPFEIRKRYTFSQDPESAEFVQLIEVGLVVVPFDEDLSFVQRIVVYAELEDETRVPIAIAQGFEPGETSALAEVLYDGNLASLLRDDGRLVLIWEIEPSMWYRPFPTDGLEVIGRANVEITL